MVFVQEHYTNAIYMKNAAICNVNQQFSKRVNATFSRETLGIILHYYQKLSLGRLIEHDKVNCLQ